MSDVTHRLTSICAALPLLAAVLVSACATPGRESDFSLASIPAVDDFCLAAERVVTRTALLMRVTVHPDFDAFVKSKAVIEGPTIQQFNWTDAGGRLIGISCKLKSADHLVATFGPGSAGPDGACQDFNRAIYELLARESPGASRPRVVFDPAETVVNDASPGMTGPDWLAPFTLTSRDADGTLRIHTKGFVVDFHDPRFAAMPVRFRGVHYCHFIAPDHLRELLQGRASTGAVIGRRVDSIPASMTR